MDEYDEEEPSGPEACSAFQRLLELRLADEELDGAVLDAGEHGRECGECAALGRLIEALAEAPPLETPDLARRVLVAYEAGRRRRRFRLLALSATAGLAAAAALLFALVPGAAREARVAGAEARGLIAFAVERGGVRTIPPEAVGNAPQGGVQRITADNRPALLTSDRNISIGLDAGATVALLDLDARAPVLALEGGRVAFRIDPGAPQRLVIETPAGRVVVTGSGHHAASVVSVGSTVLMVEVAGTMVRIDVASGSVVFEFGEGSEDRREVAVTAGHGLGTDRSGLVPLDDERRSTLLALLGLVRQDTEAEAGAGKVAGQDEPREAEGDTAGVEPDPRQVRSDPQGRPAGGDDPANREVSQVAPAPTPGELIAKAREQRAAGNWNAAAEF
ncbi:MAG TPA: hypothetical protein VM285_01315, partial [Polyangia bacterium]|nr:hypothetical protein [Polyangia bacterium]